MFKKIQNQLLLRHPLLWNLKIVPVMAAMLVLHVIFFITGYIHGAINFADSGEYYFYDATPAIVIFFSISVSLLVIIMWLVFYFRNNAFKSFYPKDNISLYKEFLLVFVICFINCSYVFSFMYAAEIRQRNYYSEEEFSRRIDIISMASLFADGGFQESQYFTEMRNGETVRVERKTFMYKGKEYPLNSLINKSITDFSYQSREKDSLNEVRVKRWLIENRKDSVLWVMREFDKIAKEHRAEANITPEQWLKFVYSYPDYTNYITIGRIYSYPEGGNPFDNDYNFDNDYANSDTAASETVAYPDEMPQQPIDTISNNIKIIKGRTYVYPKYYVPLKQLENSYGKISTAWTSPDADKGLALFFIYFGLMVSLAVFSFRVTSGRSWLIALVSFGVASLVTGLLNVIISTAIPYNSALHGIVDFFYVTIWLLIAIVLLIYFFAERKSKGISDILLNISLWITPWILPATVLLITEFLSSGVSYESGKRTPPKTGFEVWLDNHPELFMLICAMAFFIFMYFYTIAIKRWKGVAES